MRRLRRQVPRGRSGRGCAAARQIDVVEAVRSSTAEVGAEHLAEVCGGSDPRGDAGEHPPFDSGGEVTRVVCLIKGLGRGGAERLAVDTAYRMDDESYRMHLVYLLPWKDHLAAEASTMVADVACLGRGRFDIFWPWRLRRYIARRRIDIVHTHSPLPAAFARLVAGRSCTFVHTEHNMWSRYHWATRIANAVTLRSNRAVVAVSRGVADSIDRRWLRRGVEPEVVIHGTDAERVRRGGEARCDARRRLELPEDAFVVGTVGNFTAKKDQATLLEAFSLVRQRVPLARLVLVGSGPLEPALRRHAAELGLGAEVDFTGTRGDVEQILAAFDVFALSSRYEGLPIALLEAMTAGVAPVATTVGGIPELIVDRESGRLVPPEDPVALGNAIISLARDPSLRAQLAAGALTASASCDLADAVRSIESVYERIRPRRENG